MKRSLSIIMMMVFVCAAGGAENMRVLVSPFTNNGSDIYGWLGYGIEASVIADMTKIPTVEVLSIKERKRALDEISYQMSGLVEEDKILRVGKMLGANVILSGEYTVMNPEVRITARLTLVEKGVIISSVKLDGSLNDIFGLQDEIVIRLLSSVDQKKAGGFKAPKLSSKEVNAIKKQETSFNAFEYYAKGLELTDTVSQEFLDIEQAVFVLINEQRTKAGLPKFIYHDKLAMLGRYHSMNMQVYNFFDLTDQNGMNAMGRKLMLTPELFGYVGQVIAFNYGGGAEEVAKKFVKQLMESNFKSEILNKNYNYLGVGIFRGDGDNYRYFCTLVPADLMVELVSSIPKKLDYGSKITLKFRFIGNFPKDKLGIVVKYPDMAARCYKKDGSYFEGYGVYTPENWEGDFFTVTITCDKGRGAYVIQPSREDKFYPFGVTLIAR
jgi:TolB-like protein/uncharacterized protein YkwD